MSSSLQSLRVTLVGTGKTTYSARGHRTYLYVQCLSTSVEDIGLRFGSTSSSDDLVLAPGDFFELVGIGPGNMFEIQSQGAGGASYLIITDQGCLD